MTSLLKSMQITGDPVFLTRITKADEAAFLASELATENEVAPEFVDDAVGIDHDAVGIDLGGNGADTPVAEAPPATYEDYKSRFEVELRELEDEAKQRGLEEGHAEGLAQARAEYAAQLDAFAGLIGSFRAALDQTIDGVSDIGIEIVGEAVAKIVGEAVIDRDVVISVMRQVIRKTKERTKLVVRVSPSDRSLLEGYEAAMVDGLSVASVDIVADDRVRTGGCLLETPAGNLDGRLEVQLERLREAMLSARAAASDTERAP